MREKFSDPDCYAAHVARLRKAAARPAFGALSSAARKKEWEDPDIRARRIAGIREGKRRARLARLDALAWVPDALATVYREMAVDTDEYAAAAHVRRLKREMEMQG